MMEKIQLDIFSISVNHQSLGAHKNKIQSHCHRVRLIYGKTEAARQTIWLQDILGEVIGSSCEGVVVKN